MIINKTKKSVKKWKTIQDYSRFWSNNKKIFCNECFFDGPITIIGVVIGLYIAFQLNLIAIISAKIAKSITTDTAVVDGALPVMAAMFMITPFFLGIWINWSRICFL